MSATGTTAMQTAQLEQLVRLAVYAQMMLATALLSTGESSALLPVVSLMLIVISHYATDVTQRFRLKQPVADFVALGIVLLTIVAAIRADRQSLLVVVANLQSYLQYVLLFQRKTPRVYWQLGALSLGQMAIASTLVPGPTFGFALLGYVLVGIVTFALLLVYRESARVLGMPPAVAEGAPEGRLSFAGSVAAVPPRELLVGLFPSAGLIGGLTFVTSALVFLALPRWNVERLEMMSAEPLRTVGFSKTVTLGELGEVVNNSDTVMRIWFFRGRGDRAVRLTGEPLFRGTVVTRYEDRTWSQDFSSQQVLLPEDVGSTITRQRITAEPLDVNEVFCVAPAVSIDRPDTRLRIDLATDQVQRMDDYRNLTQEFDIGTTGIIGDRQREFLPAHRRLRGSQWRDMLQPFGQGLEDDHFAGLSALAAGVLADEGLSPERDRIAAARACRTTFIAPASSFTVSTRRPVTRGSIHWRTSSRSTGPDIANTSPGPWC